MVTIYCSYADYEELHHACTKFEYGFDIVLKPLQWVLPGSVIVNIANKKQKWSIERAEVVLNG